jgi:hypothetical protein
MSNKNKPFQPQQKPVVPPVAVIDEPAFIPGTLDTQKQANFGDGLQVEGKVEETVGGAPIGEGVQINGLTVDTPAVELEPVVLAAPATTDALAAIHETLREDLDLPATNVVLDTDVKEEADMDGIPMPRRMYLINIRSGRKSGCLVKINSIRFLIRKTSEVQYKHISASLN